MLPRRTVTIRDFDAYFAQRQTGTVDGGRGDDEGGSRSGSSSDEDDGPLLPRRTVTIRDFDEYFAQRQTDTLPEGTQMLLREEAAMKVMTVLLALLEHGMMAAAMRTVLLRLRGAQKRLTTSMQTMPEDRQVVLMGMATMAFPTLVDYRTIAAMMLPRMKRLLEGRHVFPMEVLEIEVVTELLKAHDIRAIVMLLVLPLIHVEQ
eukprot:TRINITY_DN21039_c0_g1_i1.p1 TRINITY_DN21039_c0_g1~~TRINITY_DN21039_c0_g1_i1.p1  ORF type:complete len:204 (+),score=37.78 TRINITY_DN21039_c0_g1_i1:449-1060(+)